MSEVDRHTKLPTTNHGYSADAVRISGGTDSVSIFIGANTVRISDSKDAVRIPDRTAAVSILTVVTHHIAFTDFPLPTTSFDFTANTILLTSEYCGDQWDILRA